MSEQSERVALDRLVSSQDLAFIKHVENWRNDTPEKHRIRELENALRGIERFGHGRGHGSGFTCANMAAAALTANTGIHGRCKRPVQ